MLALDVEFPIRARIVIPDDWLAVAVPELRKNLDHALQLETELGGYGLKNVSPIVPDNDPEDDGYGRTHGLSGMLFSFPPSSND